MNYLPETYNVIAGPASVKWLPPEDALYFNLAGRTATPVRVDPKQPHETEEFDIADFGPRWWPGNTTGE